jgi:hypothetical protein
VIDVHAAADAPVFSVAAIVPSASGAWNAWARIRLVYQRQETVDIVVAGG